MTDNGVFTCSGPIKKLAAFIDEFPKYVSDEQRRAIEVLLGENAANDGSKRYATVNDCNLCACKSI